MKKLDSPVHFIYSQSIDNSQIRSRFTSKSPLDKKAQVSAPPPCLSDTAKTIYDSVAERASTTGFLRGGAPLGNARRSWRGVAQLHWLAAATWQLTTRDQQLG